MPIVSVIIPLYNSEPFICETIDSVLAQTYQDFEIIAVDDGSTDNTCALVTGRYGNRVTCIRQKNLGLSAARNTAIAHAQGEFLAFIDHDDRWLPEKLTLQLSLFQKNTHLALVFSDAYIVTSEGKQLCTSFKIASPCRGMVFHALLQDNFIPLSTVIVKKEAFAAFGPFDRKYKIAEDWDFFLKVSRACLVDYIPSPLVEYYVHPHSFSKNIELRLQECVDILNAYVTLEDAGARRSVHKGISLYQGAIAYTYLGLKKIVSAREYFLNSIKNYPGNVKSYGGYMLTLLPDLVSRFIVKLFHQKDVHE